MKWEIFYSDNTSITSDEATPFSIPHREDVQVIIQTDRKVKWKVLCGLDFYYWADKGRGARWWGATNRYALDHYLRQPGEKAVLFGTWLENEDYDKILFDARKKWGEKTGFDRDENKP